MENFKLPSITITEERMDAKGLLAEVLNCLSDTRYYLSMLTTIAIACWCLLPFTGAVSALFEVSIVLGWVSALTVCPVRMVTYPFSTARRAADAAPRIAPLAWLAGFLCGLVIVAAVPAAVTFEKYDCQ